MSSDLVDTPVPFNAAVDSQQYNATQGVDTPVPFNAAVDSQQYNIAFSVPLVQNSTPVATSSGFSFASLFSGVPLLGPIASSISSFFSTPPIPTTVTQTVFSEAQLKWLGGADPTDPFIVARMLAAVPNAPEPTPVAFNPAVDSQQYNATQGVDTPVPFNAAVDSQQYNATQGADVPVPFNPAVDSQQYNATQGVDTPVAFNPAVDSQQYNATQGVDTPVPFNPAVDSQQYNATQGADVPVPFNPAVDSQQTNVDQGVIVPDPQAMPAPAEFGATGSLDAAIINNATADAIAVDGLDAQIASNAAQDAIIAEKQTVSVESLAADQAAFEAAAPEAVLDPAVDPAVALQEQIAAETPQPFNPAVDSQQYNATQGVDTPVPFNPAVDSQQYNATQGVDTPVAFNPAVDSQQYNATQGADVPTSFNAAVDSQQYNATQGVDTPVAFNPAQDSQAYNNTQSGTTAKDATIASANAQDVSNFQAKEDWRVRLSLSPGSNYLYKSPSGAGILQPLVATDGVIFPYTPNIVVSYAAQYDPTTLTHSNYKIYQYSSSSVDSIAITAEFTAQDTAEANYLLAVIHFFKSVTKMFYGQDQDPQPGTPPPLCYLSGLGEFQFDAHPLAVTAFNYSLPTDVDYIRAGVGAAGAAAQTAATMTVGNNPSASVVRVTTSGLGAGGSALPPAFSASAPYSKPTYVPTRMQISITAVPIVTRYDISQKFSLKDYATGKLLQGTKRQGGGIW